MSRTLNQGERGQVREILGRQTVATQSFLDTIAEIVGCNEADASKAFHTLKTAKALKYDAYNGVYSVKHGAFLDREVLIRAINYDHGTKKKKA
jgi:hypothetical protein